MRFYHLALMLFMFQISLSLINGIQVASDYAYIDPATNWTQTVQSVAEETNATVSPVSSAGEGTLDIFATAAMLIQGLYLFTTSFFQAVLMPNYVLHDQIGIPEVISLPLSAVMYMIYLAGLIQLLFNRPMGQME